MRHLNWGLLRYALYTSRKGTVSRAAEALYTTHATVIRNLKKLEDDTGTQLFIKSKSGYFPTDNGKLLVELAERIEDQIFHWERGVERGQAEPSGVLKVTTTQEIFKELVSPLLPEFCEQYPRINIEFNTSYEFSNTREFDVALRSTYSPPEHLVGRQLKNLHWAVYQHATLDPEKTNWIGFSNPGIPPAKWMQRLYPDVTQQEVVAKSSSLSDNVELTRSGLGRSLLPHFLADGVEELVLVEELPEFCTTKLWLIYHQESRGCAKVQTFVAWITNNLLSLSQ